MNICVDFNLFDSEEHDLLNHCGYQYRVKQEGSMYFIQYRKFGGFFWRYVSEDINLFFRGPRLSSSSRSKMDKIIVNAIKESEQSVEIKIKNNALGQ